MRARPARTALMVVGGKDSAWWCLDAARRLAAEGWVVRVAGSAPLWAEVTPRFVASLCGVPPVADVTAAAQAAGTFDVVILVPAEAASAGAAGAALAGREPGSLPAAWVFAVPAGGDAATCRRALAASGPSGRVVDVPWEDDAPAVERLIEAAYTAVAQPDLGGLRLTVTAGPTVEDIDPVRFLSNRSSGRMGVAVARMAARRNARVHLIHGPLAVPLPPTATHRSTAVRSAAQMSAAVMAAVADTDVLIMSAAVADFAPRAAAARKIKKTGQSTCVLELVRTPDILAAVGQMPDRPFLVGFAAESEDLEQYALDKLRRKNCDLLCANNISAEGSGFGVDTNRVTLYHRDGRVDHLPLLRKTEVADRILDAVAARFQSPSEA